MERERAQRERTEREQVQKDREESRRRELDQLAKARLERERQGASSINREQQKLEQQQRDRIHVDRLRRESSKRELKAADDVYPATVTLSDAAQSPNVKLLLSVLKEFQGRLLEANQFAKTAPRTQQVLGTKQYLNYCRVREVVHLNPSSFRKRSEDQSLHFAETLLDETVFPILITGPAGYGKTSFCKWNTLNDVRALAERTSGSIPVYVPLHQLATTTLGACESAFLRSPEALQLVQNATTNGQRVRVYLDGLDEVTTAPQRDRLIDLARELSLKYPTVQIIVTARDYVTGPSLRWLNRIHLSELSDEQVTKLVANWLGDSAAEYEDFCKQLSRARTLRPLMHVPLLGTLIIAVFRKMKSLPESKVRLYEIFVELMCGGWDLAKNVRRTTRYGSQVKLGVLTRLAGLLHSKHKREGGEDDIRTAVSQTSAAFSNQWRNLFDELLEDGLLTRFGSYGIAFSHLSFQEYLTASELTDPNGTRQQNVLKLYLSGEDWWREVLAFYVGMSRRPDETEGWLRKVVVDVSKTSRLSDLMQRFEFLLDALAGAWPAWTPKKAPPVLASGNSLKIQDH